MIVTHGGNIFEICRARGWDWREVSDLSASINPLGPAPGVRPAIERALDRIGHYPERLAPVLRQKLAARWNVAPEQILVGNGATELIHFLARAWPHSRVALVTPAFSEYHRAYPNAAASTFERLPAAGLAVLAQPNNPTGEALPSGALHGWLLASDRPVLLDESFIEFSGEPSAAALTCRRRGLLVLRSMTKFYALPGLRLGALVGHRDTIAALETRREPWQVNVLAEAAALAALDDTEHAERSAALVREERRWLGEQLRKIPGLRPSRSAANFFLIHLEAHSAADLCAWFLERRIILRNCTGWPGLQGEAVRFAIRTRAENCRVVAMLKEYLCSA